MKTPPRNRDGGADTDTPPLNRDESGGAPLPGKPAGDTPPTNDPKPPADTRRFRALRAIITSGQNGSGRGIRREAGDIVTAAELRGADIAYFCRAKIIEPVTADPA